MSIALTRRVEALENRVAPQAVIVLRSCEACGQTVALDDLGSQCGSHPQLVIPEGGTVIRVRFNDSTPVTRTGTLPIARAEN
ncbi:hypothetical protein [Thiocapsa bogorovii]|uniref:hypothetical protein n=1 Tax=Thiocapsa bogorovii TaxID=521689 RepID=UPI001E4E013B|nr:hypothetical protein [Thiocapsa bogorovii]UHD18576.1 hypothetical protein LT988_11325 [Thiocapsa bogorovii]